MLTNNKNIHAIMEGKQTCFLSIFIVLTIGSGDHH